MFSGLFLFVIMSIVHTIMQGPYPIFCRGHSGGRLVCDAFIRNGVDMGHVALGRKDTESFAITNPIIYEMILNAYAYWEANDKQRQSDQNVMNEVDRLLRKSISWGNVHIHLRGVTHLHDRQGKW